VPVINKGVAFLRTACSAITAIYAAVRIVLNLVPCDEGFGVMAPATPVAATFKKYRCPNARPIVNRKALYIEYPTGYLFLPITRLIGITYIPHIAAPYNIINSSLFPWILRYNKFYLYP